MKRFYITNLFFIFLFAYTTLYANAKVATSSTFAPGEELTYNVHLNFMNLSAGTAIMSVDKTLHTINEKPCYKIDVRGTTSGALSMFGIKVDNLYGTYLDTQSLLPHLFFHHAHENEYMHKAIYHFKHQQGVALIEELDNVTKQIKCKKEFTIPNNAQDLVSAYYALREIDTNQLKIGAKLPLLNVFFQGTIYDNFQIVFLGKQVLTTSLGTFKTLVFAPVLPAENGLFAGKDAVEVFISDDENKIPLKLKINFGIGAVEMDLKEYQGLKYPLQVLPKTDNK